MNTKTVFDDFDLDVQKIYDVRSSRDGSIAPLSGETFSVAECNTCDESGGGVPSGPCTTGMLTRSRLPCLL